MKFTYLLLSLLAIMNIDRTMGADTDLHYLVREPKTKSAHPPVLIMLHGYGSNEADLFSLAGAIPDHFLVLSARAPIDMGHDGYAWYRISQSHGRTIADSAQVEMSRQLIIRFIADMQARFHFDEKSIYLCGFSQGSIMSYHLALAEPQRVKGIAILSGKILDMTKPKVKASPALKDLRIFIGHGRLDNVIPVDDARAAYAYLQSLGLAPTYHEYKEAHNISATEIAEMVAWLTGH